MELSPDGRAYQAFLAGAKSYLMDTVYPRARAEVARVGEVAGSDKHAAAERLRGNPFYEYFAFLEHYVQHHKYTSRHGLAVEAERQRGQLTSRLTSVAETHYTPGAAEVPAYYSAVDIHQHPGNLHGDLLAGDIYKASAATTQPGSTDAYGLHHRFAAVVARYCPEPRKVLDLACGFGKSALPIAQRWPAAKVEGLDLSEGCLRLAAVEAAEAGAVNLHYRLADVASTGEPDEAYDLVTSTMMLHELDTGAVRDAMREAYRVLAPGGHLVQLDFRARDAVERFFLHGHGQRNNEPYMADFDMFDIRGCLEALGFTDVVIEPFEESPGSTDPGFPKWRLPWSVIAARKRN